MCRRIRRFHARCQHWHVFWPVECKKLQAKKEKREQKKGFWSRLLSSKPTCQIILTEQNTYGWCPFCTRAQNLEYASDEYGEDLIPDSHEEISSMKVNDEEGSSEKIVSEERSSEAGASRRKFRDELLRGGPIYQDLTMRGMPSNLYSSFLDLSLSEGAGPPRQELPDIRSKEVNPGINWEQWRYVRDNYPPPPPPPPPPAPGPPPEKSLPPTPSPHIRLRSHSKNDPLGPTSSGRDHHGKKRDTAKQQIRRKPVAEQTRGKYRPYRKDQIDGPPESISPKFRTQSRRKEPPIPLVLNKDRELPEILPWIPSPESPEFPRKAIENGHRVFQRESADRPRHSPISPLDPINESPKPRYINGPSRRAKTFVGRHEHVRSMYVDEGYISPRLEQRINEVEDYWMSGGITPSESSLQTPHRSQTEPAPQKGNGKSKTGPKVHFDDHVKDDIRKGANSAGRDLIRASNTKMKISRQK